MGGDFRRDINGLRAIAVVAVLLFHFQVPGFSDGLVGVDIFFVISGDLMAKMIAERDALSTFSLLDSTGQGAVEYTLRCWH